MATESLNRQASDRQLAYIENLQLEIGQSGLEVTNNISSVEATRINESRLGMVMKESEKYLLKQMPV